MRGIETLGEFSFKTRYCINPNSTLAELMRRDSASACSGNPPLNEYRHKILPNLQGRGRGNGDMIHFLAITSRLTLAASFTNRPCDAIAFLSASILSS